MSTPATPKRTRAELAQIHQVLPTIPGWPVPPEDWPSVQHDLLELRDAFDDGDPARIHRVFARISGFSRRFRQPNASFNDDPSGPVRKVPQIIVDLVEELTEKAASARRDGLSQADVGSRNDRAEGK